MRIYYFVSADSKEKSVYQEIYKTLLARKAEVFSNLDKFNTGRLSRQERLRVEETGEFLIGKMNAVVIEASEFSPEVGYVLALAIGQRLPVLYLHKKNTKLNQALSFILENEKTKKLVSVVEYSKNELSQKVITFINKLDSSVRREKPTIKFTLRITPRLSRYLEWKSRKQDMSKADYLRDTLLEGLLERDEEYRAYEFEQGQ